MHGEGKAAFLFAWCIVLILVVTVIAGFSKVFTTFDGCLVFAGTLYCLVFFGPFILKKLFTWLEKPLEAAGDLAIKKIADWEKRLGIKQSTPTTGQVHSPSLPKQPAAKPPPIPPKVSPIPEVHQLEAALDQSAQEVRRLVTEIHRLEAVRAAARGVVMAWQEGRPLDPPLGQLAGALVRAEQVQKN